MRYYVVSLLLLIASCTAGDGGVAPDPATHVTRIEVAPDSTVLLLDSTRQFTASAFGPDGSVISGAAIQWQSSDSTTVAVNSSGLVRALWPGRVVVSAAAGNARTEVPVRVNLNGRWALKSVDGKSVPGIVNPAAECPANASARTAPYEAESGYLSFYGQQQVDFYFTMWLRCGNTTTGTAGWGPIRYSVQKPAITFSTGATDPRFATFIGTLQANRILVTVPDSWVGTMQLVYERQ